MGHRLHPAGVLGCATVRAMDDLATLSVETLCLRINKRVGLVDELGELLDELGDRVDDFGEHQIAQVIRTQAEDMRAHARRLEILTREKKPGK